MTFEPVRVGRGTQSGVPADAVIESAAIAEGSVAQAAIPHAALAGAIAGAITDAPTARLRMTINPPRFTTTTPGVMRRLPR